MYISHSLVTSSYISINPFNIITSRECMIMISVHFSLELSLGVEFAVGCFFVVGVECA